MKIDGSRVRRAVRARLGEAQALLSKLIATPSLPGEEARALAVAAGFFGDVADVQPVPLDNSIRADEYYSDPIPGLDYAGRHNLRVAFSGGGNRGGRTLLLNTHLDTVPPGEGQQKPFEPRLIDGAIFGRGACDAKGQVAAMYLAMAALRELGARLEGDLIGHLVVEEEVGGNGTLAFVRRGERADGCVVLEPTDLRIMSSVRGAVWFRISLSGRPGHPGDGGRTRRSALAKAVRVMDVLQAHHDRLLTASRGDPMFDRYADPMPLVVGQLHAGTWAAAAPGRAMLEGILGILPGRTAAEVMAEMSDFLRREADPDVAEGMEIRFMYRHDPCVCPPDHPLVSALAAAAAEAGTPGAPEGMCASCDAFLYANQLGVPTVVFGAGSLREAHADTEHLPLEELASAGEVLARTALGWCGGGACGFFSPGRYFFI